MPRGSSATRVASASLPSTRSPQVRSSTCAAPVEIGVVQKAERACAAGRARRRRAGGRRRGAPAWRRRRRVADQMVASRGALPDDEAGAEARRLAGAEVGAAARGAPCARSPTNDVVAAVGGHLVPRQHAGGAPAERGAGGDVDGGIGRRRARQRQRPAERRAPFLSTKLTASCAACRSSSTRRRRSRRRWRRRRARARRARRRPGRRRRLGLPARSTRRIVMAELPSPCSTVQKTAKPSPSAAAETRGSAAARPTIGDLDRRAERLRLGVEASARGCCGGRSSPPTPRRRRRRWRRSAGARRRGRRRSGGAPSSGTAAPARRRRTAARPGCVAGGGRAARDRRVRRRGRFCAGAHPSTAASKQERQRDRQHGATHERHFRVTLGRFQGRAGCPRRSKSTSWSRSIASTSAPPGAWAVGALAVPAALRDRARRRRAVVRHRRRRARRLPRAQRRRQDDDAQGARGPAAPDVGHGARRRLRSARGASSTSCADHARHGAEAAALVGSAARRHLRDEPRHLRHPQGASTTRRSAS